MSCSRARFLATRALSALAVAAALTTLADCGSSRAHSAAPVASPPSASPPMPSMTTPASGSAAPAAAPVSSNAVMIQNFAFAAPSVTVKVGATVTWTNGDEDPHTVTAIGGRFHSPTLTNGAKFSYTFTTAGTFKYMCTIHPFMHGTVVVTR